MRKGVEGGVEVLQDGQPLDTRPLRLRGEASGSGSDGGGESQCFIKSVSLYDKDVNGKHANAMTFEADYIVIV